MFYATSTTDSGLTSSFAPPPCRKRHTPPATATSFVKLCLLLLLFFFPVAEDSLDPSPPHIADSAGGGVVTPLTIGLISLSQRRLVVGVKYYSANSFIYLFMKLRIIMPMTLNSLGNIPTES